ncbi:hypothetical protein M758_UG311900 [Ceratodon purpureus]|nr:hypothetical protein M758_UG311900 [Ceratodon purpureus]
MRYHQIQFIIWSTTSPSSSSSPTLSTSCLTAPSSQSGPVTSSAATAGAMSFSSVSPITAPRSRDPKIPRSSTFAITTLYGILVQDQITIKQVPKTEILTKIVMASPKVCSSQEESLRT